MSPKNCETKTRLTHLKIFKIIKKKINKFYVNSCCFDLKKGQENLEFKFAVKQNAVILIRLCISRFQVINSDNV